MAQSVEWPTSAQVMILKLMSLSPPLGSVLTAQSLETASKSVTLPFPLPYLCFLSLSLFLKNKYLKIKKKKTTITDIRQSGLRNVEEHFITP